jgi:hypothetical protein
MAPMNFLSTTPPLRGARLMRDGGYCVYQHCRLHDPFFTGNFNPSEQ